MSQTHGCVGRMQLTRQESRLGSVGETINIDSVPNLYLSVCAMTAESKRPSGCLKTAKKTREDARRRRGTSLSISVPQMRRTSDRKCASVTSWPVSYQKRSAKLMRWYLRRTVCAALNVASVTRMRLSFSDIASAWKGGRVKDWGGGLKIVGLARGALKHGLRRGGVGGRRE